MKRRLRSLPRSNNGVSRGHSSFGLYEYQKEELRRRARGYKGGVTVSYYMNMLLWNDWLQEQEKGRRK